MTFQHDGYSSDNLPNEQPGDQKPGRFYFSQPQKERLNQEFRQNNNPSKVWRQELATELLVPVKKIDLWYGARRQKEKIVQEKKLKSIRLSFLSSLHDLTKNNTSVPIPSPAVTISDQPTVDPSKAAVEYEPITEPIAPVVPITATTSSDFNSNNDENAAIKNLDSQELARHILNLGKAFDELKTLFDQTEAKIKRKVPEAEPTKPDNAPAQDESNGKILEQFDVCIGGSLMTLQFQEDGFGNNFSQTIGENKRKILASDSSFPRKKRSLGT